MYTGGWEKHGQLKDTDTVGVSVLLVRGFVNVVCTDITLLLGLFRGVDIKKSLSIQKSGVKADVHRKTIRKLPKGKETITRPQAKTECELEDNNARRAYKNGGVVEWDAYPKDVIELKAIVDNMT
jgi:hypothetical protein